MKPRAAGMLLVLVGVVVATPVPKPAPKKLKDVYGEVADPTSDCKFQMTTDGKLTIDVPTGLQSRIVGNDLPAPLLRKQMDGDFVLTARMTIALPDTPRNRATSKKQVVMAGVGVSPTDTKVGAVAGIQFTHDGDNWAGRREACFQVPEHEQTISGGWKGKPGTAFCLRLTRRGVELKVEYKADDMQWEELGSLDGLKGRVTVGPVVCQSFDKEFFVTFDQYDIQPLKSEDK